MLTLADVLEALTNFRPIATTVITEPVIDSRQVIPGSLFVAIPGEKADGHDFVAEAFRRGASFALIQRDVNGSFKTLDLRAVLSIELGSSGGCPATSFRGRRSSDYAAKCVRWLCTSVESARLHRVQKDNFVCCFGDGFWF